MLDKTTPPVESTLGQPLLVELADTETESKSVPWVTRLASTACVTIFLVLQFESDPSSSEAVEKFGCCPGEKVWDGAYWSLFTSVFVHLDWWHLGFNVFWLWVLGSRIERAIGSLRFLGFFSVAAFVSSALELAVSGNAGYGATGVVYALFGFMWIARQRYPQFHKVLGETVVWFFFFWLIGCVVVTILGVLIFDNTAHVAGLMFGSAVSACWVTRYKPRIMLAGIITLIAMSIVSLYWCPWSIQWLGKQAYDAHVAGHYEKAIELYTRMIKRDPKDATTYYNRGIAYESLGEPAKAQADLTQAVNLKKPERRTR